MNSSSILRLTLFVLLTAVFVTGLIAYSHSRGYTGPEENAENADATISMDERVRKYERQFTVQEGGNLIVEADAGTIKLESWDKNEVSIVVEIEGSDSRAEKYKVDFSQEGNTITVTGKVRDKSFFKWHVGSLEAFYTIYTPRKFNTTLNTSGGNIDAKNLSGKAEYNTSGGDVKVQKLDGDVILATSGGNVDAVDINGNVDAETSGGNVVVENVIGNVKGYTSGGDVELNNVEGRVKGGTSGGDIIVRVAGENKGIDVETSGGDIEIFVKDGTGADIDAETSGGTVDCDLPVTVRGKVRESELHGKINGGGNPIRANTTGGSIRISTIK